MPLVRSLSQGGGAVVEHYREPNGFSLAECRAAMCDLIPKLDAELPNTQVWGLTSHDTLCLESAPEYDGGDFHVAIEAYLGGGFRVSYKPPDGELPIPDASVTFQVRGVSAQKLLNG